MTHQRTIDATLDRIPHEVDPRGAETIRRWAYELSSREGFDLATWQEQVRQRVALHRRDMPRTPTADEIGGGA